VWIAEQFREEHRAALEWLNALPPVRPMTGHAADLRVLTEYRDQLVNERTATANRVHRICCGCGPATSTSCRT
jgi:hypothetical protein